MVRILTIGYAPDAVDFSDPAIPPGMNEARVAAGLKADLEKMQARGWDAEHMDIRPEDDFSGQILERLADNKYDCIVIGAGVRMTTRHVPEFERVVAAVHQGAPHTPLAFNSGPDTSDDAAARWVS